MPVIAVGLRMQSNKRQYHSNKSHIKANIKAAEGPVFTGLRP